MSEPLFDDAALQERFEREGFVVLPLLGEAELARLRDVYRIQDRGDAPSRPVHYTIDNPDRGHVRRVMEGLIDVLAGALRRYVKDLQVVTTSFVVKEPNPMSATPLHQDWSFVDETRWRSATVWAPLQDVDFENGALGVIHGSHRFFGTRRRCSPAPACEAVLDKHGFALFPFMDVQPLRAGEAIVFDNALIHGAPPNVTDRPRVAAGISITRGGAQLQHSYLVPGSQPPEIVTYAVDWRFYADYGNDALSKLYAAGKCPEGAKELGRQPRVFEPVAREALFEMVQKDPRNRFDPKLVERLKPLAERYGIRL
jgi:hypothetical protein